MSRAAHMANRAALLVCGSLAAFLLAGTPASAAANTGDLHPEADAGISIVNGKTTSIGKWPWQVGLVLPPSVKPGSPVSRRFFCGGSVIAPRLVITAGHCVASLTKRQVRRLYVVSGRTRLNSDRGQTVGIAGFRMPRDASGKRRYRVIDGAADWDVALLVLSHPLAAEPIRLAGPSDSSPRLTGQPVWATGWGYTRPFASRVPASLQVTRQVIMGNGICGRIHGRSFRGSTQICLGGPAGNASTCSGDSGGPLVVPTSDGYRLVGLTSYGSGACLGNVPSVDTRVSPGPIQDWVGRSAMAISGRNVIGSGGSIAPPPVWCKVPNVSGRTPSRARQLLEAAGCQLGKVRFDRMGAGPRGRIIGYSRYPGWLAPPGFKMNVWIAP